jgi:hypothetical protein
LAFHGGGRCPQRSQQALDRSGMRDPTLLQGFSTDQHQLRRPEEELDATES